MKSCPTCNRTYPDDTLAFCLMDGSVLSAPYDPELKKEGRPREPSSPRTEVMKTPEFQYLPATQAASEPADSLSTITSSSPIEPLNAPVPPMQNSADDRSKQQSDAWLWVAVVLVALVAVMLLLKFV